MSAKIGTLLKWFFKHARLNYLHIYSKSSISSDPVTKIRHTDAQGHASERAHSGPTVLAESDSAGPLQDKHQLRMLYIPGGAGKNKKQYLQDARWWSLGMSFLLVSVNQQQN